MMRSPVFRFGSVFIVHGSMLAHLPTVYSSKQIPALARGTGAPYRHFTTAQPAVDAEKPVEKPESSLPQRSRWHKTPKLPYINQLDVIETLDTHINTSPLQHVLLMWGTKDAGKTGALLKKAAEWEKLGHPVIEVDLKGFGGTLAEFAKLLETATIAALARHNRTLPEELLQKALEAQQFRAKGATSKALTVSADIMKDKFTLLWRSLPDVALAYLNYIPFFGKTPKAKVLGPTVATGEAFGPWFKSVTAYIGARMSKPKSADFVSFFELLEEVARLQQDRTFLDAIRFKSVVELKPPIVIIREIQRLDDLSDAPEVGRQVFSRLFEYFEPRKQGQSRVPVIIETSDFLWSRLKQILSSQSSFKAKQVGCWNQEEAEEWLVKRMLPGQPGPVFTQDEFNKVWDFSGGHAGTIYFIHSGLIAGTSLEKTIEEIRLETYGIVSGVVRDGQDSVAKKRRLAFLRELRAANYSIEMPVEPSEEMVYFLKRNVLFFDGEKVYPRNKVYTDVIEQFLNKDVNK